MTTRGERTTTRAKEQHKEGMRTSEDKAMISEDRMMTREKE